MYYSGKKKKHTLKIQLVADASTLDVLCIFVGKGSQHDFSIFKNSKSLSSDECRFNLNCAIIKK